MGESSDKKLSTIKSWGRHTIPELSAAERTLARGIELSSAGQIALLTEARELAEPYMAVLVLKRINACVHNGAVALENVKWLAELDQLASRWTTVTADAAERMRLVELLDQIVGAEQKRLAGGEEAVGVPLTSRFETRCPVQLN